MKISIAAVQFKWSIADYKSRITFQNRINAIMEDIRAKTDPNLPLLVVFPEDIGTPFLLFAYDKLLRKKTTFTQAVKALILSNLGSVLGYKLRYGISLIRALLLSKGSQMEKDYTTIFSQIAVKYNSYIVAGSITLPDFTVRYNKQFVSNKNVYNISFFFGPDGSILGKQKKVHLVDFEGKEGFDLSNGKLSELKVFETPFGKVGIAICLDAFKDDVCEVLSKAGTDILVQPSANNGEWTVSQQEDWLNGCYLAVHNKKMFKYAVNPMMNGSIFDLSFEGQSSILSSEDTKLRLNYSLLEPIDGFVGIAQHNNTEEIIISTIELKNTEGLNND